MIFETTKLSTIVQGLSNRCYIIGETAYNHEGSLEYLKKMAEELSKTGASAIKYHMLLQLDDYMTTDHPVRPIIKDWLFTKDEWAQVIGYSRELGLEVIILADDLESIRFIIEANLDVAGIELHSTALNDYHMIQALSGYKRAVLLGIGGSDIGEMHYAIRALRERGVEDIALMYGFQKYPTDYGKINLRKMAKLREVFDIELGYADHTRYDDEYNLLVTSLGVAMGARIVEKHFTLDEGLERVDYQAAIGIPVFTNMVQQIGLIESALGDGDIGMTKDEQDYGIIGPMKKAMVASRNLIPGSAITYADIAFKRTRDVGLFRQSDIDQLVGKRVAVHISKDQIIQPNHLEV